jgi:hypothetical protein
MKFIFAVRPIKPMTKKLFLAVLAASVLSLGCHKATRLEQPSGKTPDGPVELRLRWTPGEHIVKSVAMKMNMEITLPGRPAPMKQDVNLSQDFGLTVVKEDADHKSEVDMQFLSIAMDTSIDGKTVLDYDSKKSAATSTNSMSAAIEKTLQGLIGFKLQYFLDSSNNVEKIEGVDQLMNQISAAGPAGASLKSMFNDGYLKGMIGENQYLPGKPVSPSDTWPAHIETDMGSMGTMVMDFNFTFQNWEMRGKRNCARLDFDGTLKTKPNPSADSSAMSMSIQDGKTSGTLWFDPELGIVLESTLNHDMNMAITTQAAGKTINLQNVMHQVITTKLESVD